MRIHYQVGGQGSPVVLLHGYAETSAIWTPLMARLARTHTVIVPDLRGAGGSDISEGGYEKKNMAVDIHQLVSGISAEPAVVVGHDIGLMVAYAYAAQYPQDVARLALVAGRERTYFEHFWNDFAADRARSMPEAQRQAFAASWARPGRMRAGFAWFEAFERDADDFARFSRDKLHMPVLALAGEKSGGDFLIRQVRLVADDVDGHIVAGSGHGLMEEQPEQTSRLLYDFIR